MTKPEHIITVVREWLEKTDNDLKNATHTLTLGAEGPTDTMQGSSRRAIGKKYLAREIFERHFGPGRPVYSERLK
jgi:hypothetical protein